MTYARSSTDRRRNRARRVVDRVQSSLASDCASANAKDARRHDHDASAARVRSPRPVDSGHISLDCNTDAPLDRAAPRSPSLARVGQLSRAATMTAVFQRSRDVFDRSARSPDPPHGLPARPGALQRPSRRPSPLTADRRQALRPSNARTVDARSRWRIFRTMPAVRRSA